MGPGGDGKWRLFFDHISSCIATHNWLLGVTRKKTRVPQRHLQRAGAPQRNNTPKKKKRWCNGVVEGSLKEARASSQNATERVIAMVVSCTRADNIHGNQPH